MARYIDADAVDYDDYWWNRGYTAQDCKQAERLINEQPTADVVEVVYGKNISKSGFLCSICGFGDFDGFHGYKPNYCPNCGAEIVKEVTE